MKPNMNVTIFSLAVAALTAAAGCASNNSGQSAGGPTDAPSTTPYNQTPTRFVEAKGARLAYREAGPDAAVPIVLMQHITGTMDDWDPELIDGLARQHRLVIFDNPGIGASGGASPESIEDMAHVAENFVDALGFKTIDVLGFSMGGFVAQQVLADRPGLVRRVVLAGTSPRGAASAKGIPAVFQDAFKRSAELKVHPKSLLFFPETPEGREAAGAVLDRLGKHTVDPDPTASDATVGAQMKAYVTWGSAPADYAALEAMQQPTLITSGSDDVIAPLVDSITLSQHIPKSKLITYPLSGHGFLFQYHDRFITDVDAFLR